MYYEITDSDIQNLKNFKPNLNINTQITIHVPSLPWHSGKVLESNGRKSAGVSSKPTRYVSNFKNKGKECNIQKLLNDIQKLLNDIQKLLNDIQNMIC